jgi:flagellar hook assembly protein FlgD
VPNPFNPSTRIAFEVQAENGHTEQPVRVTVYDAHGRLVRRLVDGGVVPGEHSVTWDGRNDAGRRVASGQYYYRLTIAGRIVGTDGVVLLK